MFRPISMVVPDSTLIAEIILFGEGFNNCKVLWVKKMWRRIITLKMKWCTAIVVLCCSVTNWDRHLKFEDDYVLFMFSTGCAFETVWQAQVLDHNDSVQQNPDQQQYSVAHISQLVTKSCSLFRNMAIVLCVIIRKSQVSVSRPCLCSECISYEYTLIYEVYLESWNITALIKHPASFMYRALAGPRCQSIIVCIYVCVKLWLVPQSHYFLGPITADSQGRYSAIQCPIFS